MVSCSADGIEGDAEVRGCGLVVVSPEVARRVVSLFRDIHSASSTLSVPRLEFILLKKTAPARLLEGIKAAWGGAETGFDIPFICSVRSLQRQAP